jgi:hypothetical protein
MAVANPTGTIDRMPKRKKTGGEHTTPRTTIQIPVPWLELARKQANRKQKPTLWHILSLLAAEADATGDPRPRLPWEEDE